MPHPMSRARFLRWAAAATLALFVFAAPRLAAGGIMERQRALLADDDVPVLRRSRDETVRLTGEMRMRILETARPECEALQTPIASWIDSVPGARVTSRVVVLDALVARIP